jgi:hypothetical protein
METNVVVSPGAAEGKRSSTGAAPEVKRWSASLDYLQITTDRLREPMQKISSKLMELMGIQLKEDEEQ